jgi:hypothetical protein
MGYRGEAAPAPKGATRVVVPRQLSSRQVSSLPQLRVKRYRASIPNTISR